MAQKRMFSLSVIDTDAFMDMPAGAQALYFHLGMHGDDDGFVASPRKITRAAGCAPEDLETLIQSGFIISFESGVVAIRDWRLNNDMKNDRYHETVYQEEKAGLVLDAARRYTRAAGVEPNGVHPNSRMETEHNVEEHNVEEHNGEEHNAEEQRKGERGETPRRAARFTPPALEEVEKYCLERRSSVDPKQFMAYYTAKGWRIGKESMKDWQAAIRNWERRDANGTGTNQAGNRQAGNSQGHGGGHPPIAGILRL